MLLELCIRNYATSYGFINNVNGIFQDYTRNYLKIINMDTFLEPSNWIKHKNEKLSHLWKFPKSWQKRYTNQTKNYENTNTFMNPSHTITRI